jgi:hypothetical protein
LAQPFEWQDKTDICPLNLVIFETVGDGVGTVEIEFGGGIDFEFFLKHAVVLTAEA